jgi:hypothetical protein
MKKTNRAVAVKTRVNAGSGGNGVLTQNHNQSVA